MPKTTKTTNKPQKSSPLSFLKEVREELTKVTWPTKNETIRLTTIVISVSVIIGAYIAGLDYLFTQLAGLIIKK